MIVLADVIDIRIDQPRANDVLLVDTNVWFWAAYSAANTVARPYQIRNYGTYFAALLTAGSSLYKSALSGVELAHIIERAELDAYNQKNIPLGVKQFRQLSAERQKVIYETSVAWYIADAATQGNTITAEVDDAFVADYLSNMATQALDAYDYFMLRTATAAGIAQLLTDDGDFGQVAGIEVFTANNLLINAAAQQGKLIRR